MKAFLLRLAAFVLAALVLFCGVLGLSAFAPFSEIFAKLTSSTDYSASASEEIGGHIANVQADDGAAALILGDSVCWQVFDPFSLCNTAYRIDGSNRAVTIAGQYLLAKAFLDAHPGATDVYLILTPESFSAGFDAGYGYQYAAAPFAAAGLLGGLDETTRAELTAAYGAPFLTGSFARWADASPLVKKLYLNALELLPTQENAGPLIPLAERNLRNLADLCAERGAAFHLLCAPLADTEDRRNTMAALEAAFRDAGLYDACAAYFTETPWYDPALFGEDGIHFDNTVADMDFCAQVVRDIQASTGLLDGLVLSYD